MKNGCSNRIKLEYEKNRKVLIAKYVKNSNVSSLNTSNESKMNDPISMAFINKPNVGNVLDLYEIISKLLRVIL
jgi:hypothetical protein